MTNSTYDVVLTDFLQMHFGSKVTFVRDRARPNDPKLDAYVRSGDYFVTLATLLENLASDLPETSVVATSLALSRLSDELLYVHSHYKIVPKQPQRRADRSELIIS